jgi:hypothetical protein
MSERAAFIIKTVWGLGVELVHINGHIYHSERPRGMPDDVWQSILDALEQHETEIVAFIKTCPLVGRDHP